MRVAVMGAGGTGGYFGGLLARSGAEVTFVARGRHLEAIQQRGLQVKSVLDGDFVVDASVTDDPASIGEVDFVLFSVKMHDTRDAAELIKPVVGANTLIASTQNGIDGERIIGEILGEDHVLGATATVSAIVSEPGVVDQRGGPGTLLLGEIAGGSSDRLTALVEFLKSGGVRADIHEDIQQALWQKFMFICALSGLTALTRLPIGDIAANESSRQLLVDTMLEVVGVANASGVALSEVDATGAMSMFDGLAPGVRGSMSYDLDAGNRLELEFLNGKVAQLGSELGISTPVNSVISAALAPFAAGRSATISDT